MSLQVSTLKTITAGETKSAAIPVKDFAQAGFKLPSAFTGTSISFEVSVDQEAASFAPFHSNTSDVPVSITVSAGKAYAFPLNLFPWPWVKIVSNAVETGDRVIEIAQKY